MDLDPAAHGLVSFIILGLICTVTSGTLPIISVHSLQYCCVQIKGVTTKRLFCFFKSYCSNMDISLNVCYQELNFLYFNGPGCAVAHLAVRPGVWAITL